jgi:hypothetical protein
MPIVPIGFHTCALGGERSANKLGRAVHLDERVLRAFAGEHVAGHLSAHAAGQISNVDNFLNFAAAFARDLAHLH